AMPAEARRLCDQCLAKDPDDRPSSHEVAAALAEMGGVTSPAGVATFGPGLGEPKTGGPASSDLTEPLRFSDLTKRLRTSTLHTGSARAPAARGKRRTAAAVGLAAALLLAVGAAAWMPGPTGAVAALAALAPSTPADQCRVRYQVERVWRDGFEATVKMTNSGGHDLRDATLRFAFPSDQTIRTSQSWVQVGHEVSAPLGGTGHALPAGASVELTFTASYAAENLLPTAFYVGAAACETTVAATAPTPVPTAQRTPSTKDKSKKKNADN
ncbi:MAG: eukaryotic-like serine/threonine-protein kinase, partial [Micromonosporaceae bacterium]|nr:eukaryotic-like serine/threonine-protein kinase [Micromonosporaceae bacterium]